MFIFTFSLREVENENNSMIYELSLILKNKKKVSDFKKATNLACPFSLAFFSQIFYTRLITYYFTLGACTVLSVPKKQTVKKYLLVFLFVIAFSNTV